ncbi:terminase small subunit [Aminipila sp.]|uniref:terminase small subunit n=1 Tax=Aminipila sp. TaxID=2060095 RepID=UPI0028992213|nr:terminase small subunit [Aminipila sp.]
MAKEELTDKQKRFADEYLIDPNATRAYKAAYPNVKKDETAKAAASRLLTNVNVKEYLDEQLEKIQSDKIADATEVMEYLTSVMRREHKENVVVTIKEEQSKYVPDENGTMRKQTIKTEVPKLVEIPARLADANKAAELLGKRYRLFTDNLDINVETSQKFDDMISQLGGEGLDE